MGVNVVKSQDELKLRSRTLVGSGITVITTTLPRVKAAGARMIRFIIDGTGATTSDPHAFRFAQHPQVTSANETGNLFHGFTRYPTTMPTVWNFDLQGPYIVTYVATNGMPVYTMEEVGIGVVPSGTATQLSATIEVWE